MIYYVEVGPVGSKIVRLHTGSKALLFEGKHIDIQPPKWSDSSTHKQCKTLADLPDDRPIAILLGKSNLIALDFDDDLYDDALAINSELNDGVRCKNIFKSINKDGGHLIYRYSDNKLTQFIGNSNGKKQNKLDTLYGNCLLYAANKANETKQTLELGPLTTIPLSMQQLVIERYKETVAAPAPTEVIPQETHQASKLGFIAEAALTSDDAMLRLLNIITPQRYKDILGKSKKSLPAVHPDRVPDGEGHLYMVSLSMVLLNDPSISPDIHKDVMVRINEMMSEPLSENRLYSIVNRDIANPDYKYDTKWRQATLTKVLKHNKETVEIYCVAGAKNMGVLVHNTITSEVMMFENVTAGIDYITSVTTGEKLKKELLLAKALHVNLRFDPGVPFGFDYPSQSFNTYKRTAEQEIFYNPSEYRASWSGEEQTMAYKEGHPRWPKVSLAAISNSAGEQAELFLKFMSYKFKTRRHSPVFFVFYGVPHSFKSGVVNGLLAPLVYRRYASIAPEVICDKYNGWQVDRDIILIDEVHYLNKYDADKLIRVVNEISGSPTISSLRRMHKEAEVTEVRQTVTFIMATNEPLRLTNETKDRRMVVFKSMLTASEALGMTNEAISKAIAAESRDFAYYLATLERLDPQYYESNAPWKNEAYEQFQGSGLGLEDNIVKALDSRNYVTIRDALIEGGATPDLIKSCVEKIRGKGYRLRLYNSAPSLAATKGILDNMDLNHAKIKKKLMLIHSVSFRVNDARNAQRKYIGNKLTGAYVYYDLEDLADIQEDDGVADLTNQESGNIDF